MLESKHQYKNGQLLVNLQKGFLLKRTDAKSGRQELTDKSAISLLLSGSVLATLQELSSLSSCIIKLQWVPGHSFLLENDAANELTRRRALLVPSAISCRLSSLISRIHSFLFSDRRRTVSSKFFDTQVPSCVFETTPAVRRSARVNKSFLQRLQTPFREHLSSHSALSSYALFVPLAL